MKEYAALRKKYSLPKLDELEKDFSLGTIEEKKFFLREIVKKIVETIETYAKLLEETISPETSVSNMQEANSFNEEEKKLILKNYKKLLFYHRSQLELNLDYDEAAFAGFVKEFYDEWQKIKRDLSKVLNKMKNSWNKDVKTKLELGYFG